MEKKRQDQWLRLDEGLAARIAAREPDESEKAYTTRKRAILLGAGYTSSTIANWATRGLPSSEIGNLAKLMGWRQEYLERGELPKEAGSFAAQSGSAQIHTIGDYSRKIGHTHLSNARTTRLEPGQLIPLLPWNRVDLMLVPNDAPEVAALKKQDVLMGGSAIDPMLDKAFILDMDVEGTIAKTGYVAVFRPAMGRKLRPTVRPILVKSTQHGSYHFVSYNALTGMRDVQVIAVCIHCYLPMHEDPFLD